MNRRAPAFALLALPLLAVPALPVQVLAMTSATSAGPCAAPTIIGTAEHDELVGTEGPDVIDGLGGGDEITGLGGDDILCGGSGSDDLDGGDGNDRLHGGTDTRGFEDGSSYLVGDTLAGGPGDDLLDPGDDARGDGPDDTLFFLDSLAGVVVDLPAGTATGEGSDTVVGEVETVVGSNHDDVVLGTDEDQWFYGAGGSDRLEGGGGDDRLEDHPYDYVDDTSEASAPTMDVETNLFFGGPGDDGLIGADGDDDLRGGSGSDTVRGGGGSDQVRAGPGRDFVTEAVSAVEGQLVSGGRGFDGFELYFIGADDVLRDAVVRIDLGAGTARATTGTTTVDVPLPGFESVSATFGKRWFVRGTDGPNGFYTSAPVSVVAHGLGGHDTFFGSWRDDRFDGGAGHDMAIQSRGRDRYVSVERLR